jgi:hypothetical protein
MTIIPFLTFDTVFQVLGRMRCDDYKDKISRKKSQEKEEEEPELEKSDLRHQLKVRCTR